MSVWWTKGFRSPSVSVLSQEVMKGCVSHWTPPELHSSVLWGHIKAVPHMQEESTGTGTNRHRQQKEGQLLWGWGRGDANCLFSSKNTKRQDEFACCISTQDVLTPWLHPDEIQHQQHELKWLLFRTVPDCTGLMQVQVMLHSTGELTDNWPLWKGESHFCFPHSHPHLQNCLTCSVPALELAGSPPSEFHLLTWQKSTAADTS